MNSHIVVTVVVADHEHKFQAYEAQTKNKRRHPIESTS